MRPILAPLRLAALAAGPLLLLLVLTLVGAAGARAADLAPPTERVILEIRGAVAATNGDGAARFDLPMLRRLGLEELRTTTPWTKGEQVFRGLPLRRLLDHVGASGRTLRASALNDYTVELPLRDADLAAAFLAVENDGRPIRVRDKGPLWVVFPWSQHPELDNAKVRDWAIWQLARLEVVPG